LVYCVQKRDEEESGYALFQRHSSKQVETGREES